VNYRSFTAGDVNIVIDLWNESMTQDRINESKFNRMVLYDQNFDPKALIICEDGKEPVGFIYSARQGDQAWIVAFGIKSSAMGKGVGKELLNLTEEKLKKDGVAKISVGPYPLNFICPGVDKNNYAKAVEFFTASGYQTTGEASSMHINLRGYQTPDKYIQRKKSLEGEYIFKPFEPSDALSLFDFVKEDFPWWMPDIRNSILAGRAEKTMILAKEKSSGRTVGFVMRMMDGTPERFGPFGTKPDTQGKGIGAILFHDMMENLIKDGIFYTYFLWTTGRNLDIYGTWGMTVYRTYAMMSKTLS